MNALWQSELNRPVVAPVARSPQGKPYRCGECGKRYTLKQAERAMTNGCAAGCSGIDIEETP